jgi:hypothetical protein
VLVCKCSGTKVCACVGNGRSLEYPAVNAYSPYCKAVVSPLTPPHFFAYPINGTIFGKKFAEHKMCVLILSIILFEIFLTL